MELKITAAGRKRVASDDFAKTLVHVIDQASTAGSLEYSFQLVATYVAVNLLVDETNFVALPAPEAGALAAFMNANDKEIRAALKQAMSNPVHLLHAVACHGGEGLEEVLAAMGVPQA